MATFTRRQKIMAGIMCLAGGAFAWDRVSSSPTPAAAATAEPPPALLATPTSPATQPLPEPSTVSSKLLEIAAQQDLDPSNSASAFLLPPTWPTLHKIELAPPPASQPSQIDLDRAAADDFIHKHHLDAVLVRSDTGVAIIDGQSIPIGHTFDHFKLISITQSTATLRRNRIQLEMRLASDSKLKRDGSVIADTNSSSE